jgi:hypothetical protein
MAAAPAPPPPPPAPPPPLKLQLLAIVREGGEYKAAVYDPDAGRMVIVGAGESVAGRGVASVAADAIELRDGAGVRRLALAEGGRR